MTNQNVHKENRKPKGWIFKNIAAVFKVILDFNPWRLPMKITTILFYGLLLVSRASLGGSFIDSEFEMVLTKDFQQKIIDEKWKTLVSQEFSPHFSFPDQIFEMPDGIKIRFSGVSLNLKTFLQKPALTETQDRLILASQNLEAQLNIAQISIDQSVTQTVGGITGTFKIQAQCNKIAMGLPEGRGHFSMSLKSLLQPTKLGVQAEDFNLTWDPGFWTTADFNCVGSRGFSDLIKTQIQKISNDARSFVEPRKGQILALLNSSLDKINQPLSLSQKWMKSRQDVNFSLRIDKINENQDQSEIIAKGHLLMEFEKSQSNEIKTLTLPSTISAQGNLSAQLPAAQSEQAILRLPEFFIKEVILQAYEAETWMHRLNSKGFSGFKSLMSSRFIQFFVWPELMSYPKSSQFLFDTYSNKNPEITGQGLSYKVKIDLLSQMLAPQSRNYVPFMNFSIPLNSKINLSIKEGKVGVVFKDSNLNLHYSWDSNYLKSNHASTKFNATLIKNNLQNSLTNRNFIFELPKVNVMEGVVLKIKKMETQPHSDLIIYLGL
jgi:hypothetical protein